MKKFRARLPYLAAGAMLFLTSSCNRGIGCPTNFNVDYSLVDTVVEVIKVIF